jgi:23S rRNA (guanine2445-N2)-methyltransferase / 23S rRNA (guanine2069-N7)-methyltransferase
MQLNGFDGEQHHFIRANCLEWLQAAQQGAQRFDLIFLDPPTFSNSTRMEGVFDIQRDHVSLIQMAANLLKPAGQLVFSTNRRDFKMAVENMEGLALKDISSETIPRDFERNKKIHQCWLVTKNG